MPTRNGSGQLHFPVSFKYAEILTQCSFLIQDMNLLKITFHTVCQRFAGNTGIEQVIVAPLCIPGYILFFERNKVRCLQEPF